jgi:riboflavin kinase/FMN adenylyltransferase
LSSGKVKTANELLGREYSISGKVISDRHIGKTLGFPTLNVKLNSDKQRLKDGVYAGYSYIDGVKYQAVINYGARPTFGLDEKLVEAHLIGFDGNLYGKNVTVYFIDFVREVVKFNSVNELVEQLKKDLITVKEMKND